jgi:hypothetical protein
MQLTLRHTLRFSLGTPARAVAHVLLTPLATPQQEVEHWFIDMPGIADAASFQDGYGNHAQLVSLVKLAGDLVVVAEGRVNTIDKAGVLGRLQYDPVPALFRRTTALTRPDTSLLQGLAGGSTRIALFHELMGRVHDRAGVQSQDGAGQVQSQGTDITAAARTHAFLGAVRALGFAVRYVTGYLLEDGGTARAHAWAEAWDDSLGWIGFDPTLNLCPTQSHVRLAAGLDAMSCPPLRTVPVWADMPEETVEIVAV